MALADHSPCRRRPGRLADRRLMQAAIGHRATPSSPRERGMPPAVNARYEARPKNRRTLSNQRPWLGPHGSSPVSEAGTVTAPPDHRGPSSSSVASITSTPSLRDRPSEMCPLHSPLAGAHRLFCGLLPFLPLVENSKIPSHPPNRQDGFRSPGQPRA